jgi:hypothetical protein
VGNVNTPMVFVAVVLMALLSLSLFATISVFEWLLRPRRERPRSRRTAEKRDELASFHSITSSARTRSVGGTSKPRTFAVFKLRTVSYLVGACTGRSAGLAPRRMRST